jgi:hypothetical protein
MTFSRVQITIKSFRAWGPPRPYFRYFRALIAAYPPPSAILALHLANLAGPVDAMRLGKKAASCSLARSYYGKTSDTDPKERDVFVEDR